MGNNGSTKQIFIAADLTMPIATPKEPAEQSHYKEYFLALSHQCLRKASGLLKGKQIGGQIDCTARTFDSEPNTRDYWLKFALLWTLML